MRDINGEIMGKAKYDEMRGGAGHACLSGSLLWIALIRSTSVLNVLGPDLAKISGK